MKRLLLKRLLLAVALVLVGAVPVAAQTDAGVQVFKCHPPNSATDCFRVHADRTSTTAAINLTITGGEIIADGGYKVAYAFTHGGRVVVSVSNTLMPIAGSSNVETPATTGPTGISQPRAGHIIAISVSASTALTAGGAHVEAVRVTSAGTQMNTGLTALLDASNSAAGPSQYNYATQGTGVDIFVAGDRVGCRWSTSSDIAPLTAMLACIVEVRH